MLKNEKRADIARGISRKVLGGAVRFIVPNIFYMFPVREIGSKFSCAKVILGEAVKNRSAGASLTGTRIEMKDVDYNCDAFEDRARLTEKEIVQYGSEDIAIESGAKTASYGVMKKVEAEGIAILFTSARYAAAYTSTAAAPLLGINNAANAVKRYGTPYLVCSESWLASFVSIPAIATLLKDLYGNNAIMGILGGEEKIMAAAGITFGVKGILVGDDNFWQVSGMTNAAAVVALRPEIANDVITGVKSMPCYGFAPTFLPTDATLDNPFAVETGYDADSKDNLVDATQNVDLNEINAEGCVLVKLPTDTTPVCAAPTFTPGASAVASGSKIVIASATGDVNIRYTVDGSAPSQTAGTLYDQLGDGVALTAAKTIKAIAYRTGYANSAVSSAAYTIAT